MHKKISELEKKKNFVRLKLKNEYVADFTISNNKFNSSIFWDLFLCFRLKYAQKACSGMFSGRKVSKLILPHYNYKK